MKTTAPARDALDDKVNRLFAGKVVRKDLVRKIKVGANVPVFVLEYLLGKYCASSDELAIQMGLQVVSDTLANNYIRPDEAMKAQSRVKELGRYTFIDKVRVRLVDSDYWAEANNFGHKFLHVPTQYVRDFERLLTGGVWAQLDLRFEYDEDGKGKYPFWIDRMTPIQIATFDLEEYRRVRREFSSDEWIDFMLRSLGYEPADMTRRLKLLFLLRLVPLTESNYNLIELGPPMPVDQLPALSVDQDQDRRRQPTVGGPSPLMAEFARLVGRRRRRPEGRGHGRRASSTLRVLRCPVPA